MKSTELWKITTSKRYMQKHWSNMWMNGGGIKSHLFFVFHLYVCCKIPFLAKKSDNLLCTLLLWFQYHLHLKSGCSSQRLCKCRVQVLSVIEIFVFDKFAWKKVCLRVTKNVGVSTINPEYISWGLYSKGSLYSEGLYVSSCTSRLTTLILHE